MLPRPSDIFTDKELTAAINIFLDDEENFHKRCRDEVVAPIIERINAASGQKNDPDFLAYFLQYAFIKTQEKLILTPTED